MLHWLMTSMCRNRLFEWIATFIMIGLAFKLIGNPQRIDHGTFRIMTNLVSPNALLGIFFLIGSMRAVTLAIDGYYLREWTPILRSVGALMAAMVWGQMGIALEMLEHAGQGVTVGSPVYFGLMLGELFSCYRPLARHGNGSS